VMIFQCGVRPADRVICGSAPAVTSIFRQTLQRWPGLHPRYQHRWPGVASGSSLDGDLPDLRSYGQCVTAPVFPRPPDRCWGFLTEVRRAPGKRHVPGTLKPDSVPGIVSFPEPRSPGGRHANILRAAGAGRGRERQPGGRGAAGPPRPTTYRAGRLDRPGGCPAERGYCHSFCSFGWAMKNSYMALLASGPCGSVKMLPGVPPDQAWPIPSTL
jgi:hypothetical protein